MIYKAAEYKNGYVIGPSSCDLDLQKVFNTYNKVTCVICNAKTARDFKHSEYGYCCLTINNNIADGCFFINKIQ